MQVHGLGLQPRGKDISLQLLDQQDQSKNEQGLGNTKGHQCDGDGKGTGHNCTDEGDKAGDEGDDCQSHGQGDADEGEADADKDGVDKRDNCLRTNKASKRGPCAGE